MQKKNNRKTNNNKLGHVIFILNVVLCICLKDTLTKADISVSSDKQNETCQDLIVRVLCWVETNASTPGQKCRRANRERFVVFKHKFTNTYYIISYSRLHRGQTLNVPASRPTVTSPCQGAQFCTNYKLLYTILLCYSFWVWELRSRNIC